MFGKLYFHPIQFLQMGFTLSGQRPLAISPHTAPPETKPTSFSDGSLTLSCNVGALSLRHPCFFYSLSSLNRNNFILGAGNSLMACIKTQVQIPRHQVKSQRLACVTVTLVFGRRARWILGACCPASLAEIVSFQSNERLFVKAIRLRV